MGENVRISTVAIAQGSLTIRITETPQVSQPNPFSNTGNTTVVDRTTIEVDENDERRLAVLPGSVTLQELVNGLNALGIGPRDMITILQAIKAARLTGEVLVAGFDGVPEFVPLLQSGELVVSGMQQPYLMGQESGRAMVDYLAGKTPPKEILVPIKIVTSSNIEQELPTIKETVFANEM